MDFDKSDFDAALDIDPFAIAEGDTAYVRPVEVDGRTAYAIHGSDGTVFGVVDDWHTAFATARIYDLDPVAVH